MEVVHRNMDTTGGKVQLTFFYHKKIKYIWHADSQQYLKLSGLEREKCGVIYSYTSGLSREESDSKLALYGPNKIDIEVKPIWQIVYDEVGQQQVLINSFRLHSRCFNNDLRFQFLSFFFEFQDANSFLHVSSVHRFRLDRSALLSIFTLRPFLFHSFDFAARVRNSQGKSFIFEFLHIMTFVHQIQLINFDVPITAGRSKAKPCGPKYSRNAK